MKRILLIIIALCGLLESVVAQKQAVDSLKVVALLEHYATAPHNLVDLASCFIGFPYKAGTLEQENEPLVVNLSEFDCVTFVETVLALKLALDEQPDYATNLNACATEMVYVTDICPVCTISVNG